MANGYTTVAHSSLLCSIGNSISFSRRLSGKVGCSGKTTIRHRQLNQPLGTVLPGRYKKPRGFPRGFYSG